MRIIFDGRVITEGAHHGIARYAAGLLNQLCKNPGGHSFTLLTGPFGEGGEPAVVGRARRAGFQVSSFAPAPYSISELVRLPVFINKLGADLYYSPTFMPPAWGKMPMAFTIHDLIHLDSPADYPLSRRLVWRNIISPRSRRAVRVITVSAATAALIQSRLGLKADKIALVRDGADNAFRPKSEAVVAATLNRLKIKAPFLITGGNPRPHKNLKAAVAAFHLLAGQGWTGSLVVIGAGLMDLPKGPGRVIRTEGISDEDLAALYSGAEGAFFASLAEGFGLPPLEAMACGCPVVVNGLEVMLELLGDQPEQKALLAEPGNHHSLARALEELVNNPVRTQQRAKLARQQAAKFTWSAAAVDLKAQFNLIEEELSS